MSKVNIESTTDTADAVTSALGKAPVEAKEAVEATSDSEASAPEETVEAKAEASADSETANEEVEETQEVEAKGQAESEDTEDVQAKTDDSETSEDKESKKVPKGLQKRLKKMTADKYQALKEAEYWKQVAMDRAKQSEVAEKKEPETTAQKVDGEPDIDNFETEADYYRALAKHEAQQILKAERQKEAQTKEQTEHDQQLETFQKKSRDLSAEIEDFDEVVNSADPASELVLRALLKHAEGPRLMYELAKEPGEVTRISQITDPVELGMELGRLNATVSSPKEETVNQKASRTNAPKPLKPVSKSATTKVAKPDELSFQEYKKWRDGRLG